MDAGFIRLSAFGIIFAILFAAQYFWPRRRYAAQTLRRTLSNLVIFVLNVALTRGLAAVTGIAVAVWASSHGIGLFNAINTPPWLAGIICFIALDFALWLQHLATHKIPALWRLHRVHHTDTAMDVTTALRFHPAEIGLSLFYKSAIVAALGAPVEAVICFEIVLNGAAMFSHSNIRLPERLDAALSKVIITPDFHLVHHSVVSQETDSNYANFLTLWDRIFQTLRWRSQGDLQTMDVGIETFRSPKDQAAVSLLFQPLVRPVSHDHQRQP